MRKFTVTLLAVAVGMLLAGNAFAENATKDECVAFGLPPLPSTLESLPPGVAGAAMGVAPNAPGSPPSNERPKPEAKTQTELPAPATKPPEPAESPDGRETAASDLGLSGAQA